MNFPEIKYCPGTLAAGYDTYSKTCLKRLFYGKKVDHVLPYHSPVYKGNDGVLDENRRHISLSGVQEKFSLVMDKNKLRLAQENEPGTHILKPIPAAGKKVDQMPANEHLTMQIARQVFGIETAENAMIFFKNGAPAYITRRFDMKEDGTKWGQEDFASLTRRNPQSHSIHYKYIGNYAELFHIMQKHLPAYKTEAPKLLKLLIFNFLFSNGDAHFKNFSILETPLGDYRLSPAYDLLNSRIHVEDTDFALSEGLLPAPDDQGLLSARFAKLSTRAGIPDPVFNKIIAEMTSGSTAVEDLIAASFLDASTKKQYLQYYQTRLKQLLKT